MYFQLCKYSSHVLASHLQDLCCSAAGLCVSSEVRRFDLPAAAGDPLYFSKKCSDLQPPVTDFTLHNEELRVLCWLWPGREHLLITPAYYWMCFAGSFPPKLGNVFGQVVGSTPYVGELHKYSFIPTTAPNFCLTLPAVSYTLIGSTVILSSASHPHSTCSHLHP